MTRFDVVLHNARQALIALDQFGNAMRACRPPCSRSCA